MCILYVTVLTDLVCCCSETFSHFARETNQSLTDTHLLTCKSQMHSSTACLSATFALAVGLCLWVCWDFFFDYLTEYKESKLAGNLWCLGWIQSICPPSTEFDDFFSSTIMLAFAASGEIILVGVVNQHVISINIEKCFHQTISEPLVIALALNTF